MADKHPAVSASDEERTTVDPGALDNWNDEKTVADPPSTSTTDVDEVTDPKTNERGGPSDVVVVNRSALGSESETVDELTIEEQAGKLRIPRPPSKLPDASLVVRTGPLEGRTFRITKPVITVGRARENDIVITDLSISRRHLKIEFDGIAFYLQDLSSGNGTIVNGRDEDDRYRLVNRDALELGRSIITFESVAMKAQAPKIAPPKPRSPQGKGKPSAQRPTQSLRSSGKHPEFVSDVDDDASTIAGQRRPGPDPSGKPPGRGPAPKAAKPRDLVMPRDPSPSAKPRMTVSSPAVPAPQRPPSSRPTLARPSQPPPIIAPVSLEEEEPTTAAAAPRRPVITRDPAPSLPRPNSRAVPSSAPPPRSHPSAPPPSRPHGSAPPHHGGPHPAHSSASVVYPTAPSQFNRSGAALALSPRNSAQPVGIMAPVEAASNRRWIAFIALLAVATVVGVAVAAISGGGGGETKAATPPVAMDAGAVSSDAAAARQPKIVELAKVDAGTEAIEKKDAGKVAAVTRTFAPEELGTFETGLGQPTPAIADKPDETKPDDPKPDETKPDDPKPDETKPDETKPDANKALVKRLRSQANAAYAKGSYSRAASLSLKAAAKTKGREAKRLRSRAKNLSSLQSLMRRADGADAITAFINYNTARKIDRRLGGKNRKRINNSLLKVAPNAARSYMAKKKYSQAAKAVTVARSLGDKSRTDAVKGALERKAQERVKSAKKAIKRDDIDKARKELKAARAMLPTQSALRSEVQDLLSDL